MSVGPELLEATAAFVVTTLRSAVDLDWSVTAGALEWDVDFTIGHMAGALAKSTLYLASRSPRFIAVRCSQWDEADQDERLTAIEDVATALANVARVSPPGATAYHVSGMRGTEERIAQACEELLVHTYDVAQGLGLPYEPDDALARPLLAFLYAPLTDDKPSWPVLLWLNGRLHPATNDRPAAPQIDAPPERIPLEFAQDETGDWSTIRWLAT